MDPEEVGANLRSLHFPSCPWGLVSGGVFFAVVDPWEEGNWRCLLCGALEHRVTCWGWVLEHGPPPPGLPEDHDSRPFGPWFERKFGRFHDHDWISIGCHHHSLARTVGCSLFTGSAYYRSLPLLPDTEIATKLFDRVVHAESAGRARMLRDFDDGPRDTLFRSIAGGRVMTRQEFDEAFTVWLDAHPSWR